MRSTEASVRQERRVGLPWSGGVTRRTAGGWVGGHEDTETGRQPEGCLPLAGGAGPSLVVQRNSSARSALGCLRAKEDSIWLS